MSVGKNNMTIKMNIVRLCKLGSQTRFLIPKAIFTSHTGTCPTTKKKKGPSEGQKIKLQRAQNSGKVRLGFVPEEWFTFFYPKTGVTGAYLFGIMLGNYMISKEIYVMEHEYYLGLSIFIMVYVATKKAGPQIAVSLDKEVDNAEAEWNESRKQEIDFYENTITESTDSQWRAKGQSLLVEAKKVNVAMQLEAAYRERLMHVYQSVKRRLDYHATRHRVETRIHQDWMIEWILKAVRKSITAEIENRALDQAITDLAAIAEGARKQGSK